jgi:perosamine synthetase
MNNITAALGLGQIQRVENQIFRKRRINKWYMDELATIDGIRFQQEAADSKSICWMTSFTLDETMNCSRDKLIALLKENNIDSRPVFPSISQYKIWGYSPTIPKVSKSIGDNGINLPSGVLLNKKTVEYICNKIKAILEIY